MMTPIAKAARALDKVYALVEDYQRGLDSVFWGTDPSAKVIMDGINAIRDDLRRIEAREEEERNRPRLF